MAERTVFNDKNAFEMSFAFMFSIIVGAIILFSALYITTKFIVPQRHISQSEAAKSLSALIDPLETGSGISSEATIIKVTAETRIYSRCYRPGEDIFGRQGISLAMQSGIGEKWQEPGEETAMNNKYIFSNSTLQGKNFYILVKQFNIPFKVADLIFLYDEKYCFVNAPRWIKDDIENSGNINISSYIGECETGSISVCFNSYACDINVFDASNDNSFSSGRVMKEGIYSDYSGNLLYAAIFSDSEIYECNIARLMARLEKLSYLYLEKSRIIEPKCSSGLNEELAEMANNAMALKQEGTPSSSGSFGSIISLSEEIDEKDSICRIF